MTDLIFFADIFITFNTGIYKNAVLVMNRKVVMLEYLKKNFWIDTLSTFPYTYIMQWIQDNDVDADSDSNMKSVM
jgi:hypothetical protein